MMTPSELFNFLERTNDGPSLFVIQQALKNPVIILEILSEIIEEKKDDPAALEKYSFLLDVVKALEDPFFKRRVLRMLDEKSITRF